MRLPSTLPYRSRWSLVLALTLGFAAVFFLPFHIPVAPSVSDSYAFGYNNRAALLLFLVFAGCFALWSGGLGLLSPDPEDRPAHLSRRLLWITLGITALVTLSLWLVYRHIGAINEGSYLVDRLQHLAAGETLYRDFEFIYGPLILLIPLALSRVCHLTLIDAYFLAWTLEWLAGVALLWLTVRWAGGRSPRANAIFLLAFLGFIFSTISMGLNYTPLRFVSAPFFAVAIWRVLARSSSAIPAALLSLPAAAWALFLSPEQGLAFCAASLLFFALFVWRSKQQIGGALVIMVGGQVLLLALLVRAGVVHSMAAMAVGGYNLPLLPSTSTVISLGLVLVALLSLINTLRLQRPAGPLEYLTLVSLCALPAAFGRCDPGHLFMNTLGAFIAAWTVLSVRPAAGHWMVWSYLAGAIFLPLGLYQANNFIMYPVKLALLSPADPHPALRRSAEALLTRTLGSTRYTASLSKWRQSMVFATSTDVPSTRTLLAPLGFPSTLLLGKLPPMTNGRYRGLGNVITRQQIEEKVNEMAAQPGTLLLFSKGSSCPARLPSGPPSAADVRALDHLRRHELFLNLLPFYVPHLRHPEDMLSPVCRYVLTHYHLSHYTAPLTGGEVWEHISAVDSHP